MIETPFKFKDLSKESREREEALNLKQIEDKIYERVLASIEEKQSKKPTGI